MNLFHYLCPSCGGYYNDFVEKGKTYLLHRGLKSLNDNSKLPSSKCVPYHNYVVFDDCGHCCPDIFAKCRACKLGFPGSKSNPGTPSEEPCHCHYCHIEDAPITLPKLSEYQANNLINDKIKNEEFDVFLCHNSEDKAEVKILGEELKKNGLRPWLDIWEIPPGSSWQRALEETITTIKSAAIFVGSTGIGPWQKLEVDAFVRNFVNRGCPTIPVILSSCNTVPELPVFLDGMHRIDFRQEDPDPMCQLIWGITKIKRC